MVQCCSLGEKYPPAYGEKYVHFSWHKGKKTNHSLRATGASELFKRGVPEKIVQERTEHRSLEALRTYERSSED